MIHNILIYVDMGHIVTNPPTLPQKINDYISKRIKDLIYVATDKKTMTANYPILKNKYNKHITYYYDDEQINITFDLYNFDDNMIIITKNK